MPNIEGLVERHITKIVGALVLCITTLSGAVVYMYQEQMSDNKSLIESLNKKSHLLEKENIELRSRVATLERQNAAANARFMSFIASYDSSPIPMWIKDRSGHYLAINEAYEEEFLAPRGHKAVDLLGKTDYEVWPKPIADKFRENDTRVLQYRRKIDVEEPVPKHDGSDPNRKMRIIKWPVYMPGIREPYATGGAAIVER